MSIFLCFSQFNNIMKQFWKFCTTVNSQNGCFYNCRARILRAYSLHFVFENEFQKYATNIARVVVNRRHRCSFKKYESTFGKKINKYRNINILRLKMISWINAQLT